MPAFIAPIFKQRRVKGQDIGLCHQRVERVEIFVIAAIGARRIAQQGFYSPRGEAFSQPSAHVTDADDAHGAIAQIKAVAFGQQQQRGEHVLHHRNRVTARRGREADTGRRQRGIIDMIGAGSGGADKLHRRAGQQRGIHFGDGAHHQRAGILQFGCRQRAARHRHHLSGAAEQFTGVGHIFIDENFHGGGPVCLK